MDFHEPRSRVFLTFLSLPRGIIHGQTKIRHIKGADIYERVNLVQLDWIQGDCWVLTEGCALLSAILVRCVLKCSCSSAASLSRHNTWHPSKSTAPATYLCVSVHGCQVQRRVSSTRSHVYIHRCSILLGVGQQLGDQLGFALLGRPVEASEARHKVSLGHEAGFHSEQGLQAFPEAVWGAQHPLVLQGVEGHRGTVFISGWGEDWYRISVTSYWVPDARAAVDQGPPDLQREEHGRLTCFVSHR